MSSYDLIIRNGTIVDGTRLPSFRADVAIKAGRIAKISGRIRDRAAQEIDATDCIVAPGFVDLHCHYDAQINWDPYCTLSGWHGVTSLTIGQCGFGFAPTRPEDREANMEMMCRIEAIPMDSMRAGMRWDWVTFPEYLDSLDRQELGLNVASLVPYSPLRAYVIGVEESRERTQLTEAEMNEIKRLFREGMEAGAFGFSADKSLEDRPEDGSFLPTHVAADEEFFALAEILREFGVGHIGWTRDIPDRMGENKDREMLIKLAEISGRPLQWGLVMQIPGAPEMHREQLDWLEQMHRRGLPMYAQSMAVTVSQTFTMEDYNGFDTMLAWLDATVGSVEERLRRLGDPERRPQLRREMEKTNRGTAEAWRSVKIIEVAEERNYPLEGKSVGEIAEREGRHPVDVFLDLSIDEGLRTRFAWLNQHVPHPEIIGHRCTHISLSDGGAHTRYQTSSAWPTHFLTEWVRDQQVMSLEDAHYKMSALPAWIAGFRDRGVLREGLAADIVVYELDRLGLTEPTFDTDFPGGERRLIQKADGYRYTIVNGSVTFEDGNATGSMPGRVLRSYEMVS
ncbi:MAG: amidohydrolase family protein [Myxococcales bacterium]|nr:amidohydrolase family protein [Myxococcales bacterium]